MLKKIPKIITTIFLVAFLFQLIGFIFILTTPEISQAGTIEPPELQIDIGNLNDELSTITTGKDSTTMSVPWIGEYISAVYKYAVGIVGILATVVMMFGGVLWITAGGNQERISNAKSWITASLTGLVLVLCSYLILNTVNPDLTRFKPIEIKLVEKPPETGCCVCGGKHEGTKNKDECEKITCKVDGKEKKGDWGGKDSVWDGEKCKEEVKCNSDQIKYNLVCLSGPVGKKFEDEGYDCQLSSSEKCKSQTTSCSSTTVKFCCSNAPCTK